MRKLIKWKSGVLSSKLDGRKTIESREKKFWSIFHHRILPRESFRTIRTNVNVSIRPRSQNSEKPFHVGHLRSTITGQAVCNLLSTENDVHRINYLGDWGIQFAKLICGFQKYHQGNSDDIWQTGTIEKLKKLYRKITEIEREPEILAEIDSINKRLEGDGEFELDFHRRCVEASEIEYRKQYQLFNVEFNSWERESNQRKERMNLRTIFQPDCPFLNSQFPVSSPERRLIPDKIESLLRRFKENGLLQIEGPNQFIEVEVGFLFRILITLVINVNLSYL